LKYLGRLAWLKEIGSVFFDARLSDVRRKFQIPFDEAHESAWFKNGRT
jgi:hypothetical protein